MYKIYKNIYHVISSIKPIYYSFPATNNDQLIGGPPCNGWEMATRAIGTQKNWSKHVLVGGWPTPLKNMNSSVGMMTFPIYGKIIQMFQTTNQINYGIRWFPKIGVSPVLIHFSRIKSIVNHPFWGTPMFGNQLRGFRPWIPIASFEIPRGFHAITIAS